MKVVTIASFISECVFRVPRFMEPGETLAGRYHDGLGGKGFNMTVAAARCGATVSPILKLGSDARGDQALAFLKEAGADLRHVTRSNTAPSGIGVILLDPSGQNRIAIDPGANSNLSAADVRAAAATIGEATVVLAQLETSIDAILEAFRIARAAGVITILNPAPAAESPLPDELLALTDILTPNETEADALVGRVPEVDWRATAVRIAAMGPASVIMTLGANGVGAWHHGTSHAIGAPVVAVTDTAGAGDAFNGALAARLASGESLHDACRFAVAYASLKVTRAGTSTAMPTADETARFLTTFPPQ
jgi:ribokinase